MALVERRRGLPDRRQYQLHTVADAGGRLGRVMDAVREHDAEITSALTAQEKTTLAELLATFAASQQLNPEIHPSYSSRRQRPEGDPERQIQPSNGRGGDPHLNTP